GRCRIGGIAVDERPVEARRLTGYLPGDSSFYESRTGRAFLREATADYPRVDRALEAELIEAFQLPLDKKLRTYSHGMKRKIGIVQALVPDVPAAILDEPEEGLDPTARRRFLDLLKRLRAGGRTILLSSHQLDAVAQVCDRVAFL